MDQTIIIISVVVVIFISIITSLLIVLSIKRKKKKESSDKTNKIKSGASVSDTYKDIPYTYKHSRGGQNSPPYFDISIDCDSLADFKISKETKFDRFFKKIGVATEIDTNDPDFDNKFYISTNSTEFSRNLLRKHAVRQSIDSLISRGFTTIMLKKKRISLRWTPYRTKSPLDKDEIEKIITELDDIRKECIRIVISERESEDKGWKLMRLYAFLIPGILEILGISALVIGLINYPPLDKLDIFLGSLKLSIPVLFLFTWFAIKLLKGRSSSHRELIIVFFISLTAIPIAFVGGKIFLNGWMDSSIPKVHKVQIIKKYFTKAKSSKTYYVKIRSWREYESTEKISIPFSKYAMVNPGNTRISVTTKEGKFGYEWILDYYLE